MDWLDLLTVQGTLKSCLQHHSSKASILKPNTITPAPTFNLPDLTKLFTLYVTEKDKVAMGVLSQTMGTWDRPVTYL